MQIVSINAADRREISAGGKTLETGIFKQPLQGPVAINRNGIDGDTIVDAVFHGGEDQALYLYSQEDYQWWSQKLGRALEPGCFGENLTLSAFPDQPLRVGDRLTIGDAVMLEITAPRVPCLKLASRMGIPTFGKQFVAAVRPGVYARVLQTGSIQAGDHVSWEPTREDYILVNDIFTEWHRKQWSPVLAKQALDSPISSIAREIIRERAGL